MKPRYLFLDIDGVLNCYSDSESLFLSEIKKESNTDYKIYKSADFVSCNKLRLLQEIVTQTGCTIIGISSWFNGLRDKDAIGKFLGVEISGVTECTGGGEGRTKSIKKFLSENEYQSFVVLDDQQDYHTTFGSAHICPKKDGLTEKLQKKCIDKLLWDVRLEEAVKRMTDYDIFQYRHIKLQKNCGRKVYVGKCCANPKYEIINYDKEEKETDSEPNQKI